MTIQKTRKISRKRFADEFRRSGRNREHRLRRREVSRLRKKETERLNHACDLAVTVPPAEAACRLDMLQCHHYAIPQSRVKAAQLTT
jgi:hypothetical protein